MSEREILDAAIDRVLPVDTPDTLTQAELAALTDYERGYIDAVTTYSWWKDGEQYVGTNGRTWSEAIDRFLRQNGRR